jgi:hypothetical protein
MENWAKLTRSEKDRLISRYGITSAGEPPEPVTVVEYDKVPAEEWDKLIQKEVPKRKNAKKKEADIEVEEGIDAEVIEAPKVEKKKKKKSKKK